MIDWDRVLQLQEEVGEEDFKEVVAMFLDEVGEEIKSLSPDLSAPELESKLHFLKGAALNLGLQSFADICRRGEDMARAGQVQGIDTAAVTACYEASMKEFADVLDGSAAA